MKIKRVVPNVRTHDLESAKKFYGDILGFDVAMDMDWIATLEAPALARPQVSFAAHGGSGTAVPDLTIEVDDLLEALHRFQKAGIDLEYGPADEPWGVRRFFVRDPFGRLVNIMEHRE